MHPVSIDSETFIMTCDHDKGLFLYHDHRIRRKNQANKGGQRHVRSNHSYYFIFQRCKKGAIILIILFFSVVKIGLKLAWSALKFVFGLGLFFFCPLLFVIAAAMGIFGSMLIPIIIMIILFTFGFIRV